jgi:S-layer protein
MTSNCLASTLTGGAGADKFVVSTVSAAKTIYINITDFSSGDSLKLANMTGTDTFISTKVNLTALSSTASLSDAMNTAIHGTSAAQINWFQSGGNTYVVQASGSHTVTTDFVDGTDLIVKLTGLVDLSAAGFNADSQLLQA